jgi:hypothetical protein
MPIDRPIVAESSATVISCLRAKRANLTTNRNFENFFHGFAGPVWILLKEVTDMMTSNFD